MEATPVSDRRVSLVLAVILSSFPLVANATPVRQLSFAERVDAQRAIELVYYSHLTGATRSFAQAVPQELLERKVMTYLKQSVALEQLWSTTVTAEMLRAEADRIGRNTKFPERLGEILAAVGHDDFLMQETLVRATLVDRLARSFFDHDERIQGGARAEAGQIQAGLLDGTLDPAADHPRRTVLVIEPIEIHGASLPASPQPPPGEIGAITEDPRGYAISVTLSTGPGMTRVARYFVPKVPWETWWADLEPQLDAALAPAVADSLSIQTWVQPPRSRWDSAPWARSGETALWMMSRTVVISMSPSGPAPR
jgi:hypothetical protein